MPTDADASPETLSQALTQKIRELLTARGWSQREFARELGVTQGAVSYLLAEKRRATDLDYYERLAKVFGVPLSVLILDLEQRLGGLAPPATTAAASLPSLTVVETTLVRVVLETLAQSHVLDARIRAAIAELTAEASSQIHQRRG